MKNGIGLMNFFMVFVFVSCGGNNEPRVKARLEGAWRCEETRSVLPSQRSYIVELDPLSKDTTQYIISNFYAVDENEFVFAKFSGTNLKITDNQSIGFSQTSVRSGSGVVSADFKQIVLDYKIYDGLNDVDVHAVYSR